MCKDFPEQCGDLTRVARSSPLYLLGTDTWDGVIKQGKKTYGNYPAENNEGTHLVYSGGKSYSANGGGSWDDVTTQVTLVSFVDDWVGVSFRYTDDDNYYRFEMNNVQGVRRLKKRVAGVVTILWNDVTFTAFDYVLYTVPPLSLFLSISAPSPTSSPAGTFC